ncbi:unnamed protein product [Tenebrio molitor]|nr:unnamed protein product [Tenebrio molitor]
MERTVWPISRIYIDFLMLLFVSHPACSFFVCIQDVWRLR